MKYAGLTWDHPRGYNALAAAAAGLPSEPGGLEITWDKHSLEGFEVRPISETCAEYDLVVLDHPHIGEAVAQDCLLPLEAVFSAEDIRKMEANAIGPCLSSYRYAEHHWALPLDAATQVMAYREDLCAEAAPETWGQVMKISEKIPVALSLAGPHAVLTYMSICTALGHPPAVIDPEVLVAEPIGRLALEIMQTIYDRNPKSALGLNPIGLLEHMSSEDSEVALVPLVYGYVNYAAPKDGRRPIHFANAPRIEMRGRPGSVLGGTGIGITKRCQVTPQLLEHLRWLMSPACQTEFIPFHDGQPSARIAWHDGRVNAAWGDFYRNTSDTLDQAYVRPRHTGIVKFLIEGAEVVRNGLAETMLTGALVRQIQDTYSRNRIRGAER